MKRWAFLFLMVIYGLNLNGQVFGKHYKDVLENAMDAFNDKDYKSAGALFEEVLDMKDGYCPYPSIYLPGFITWLELKDTTKAFQYLSRLGSSVWVDLEKLKRQDFYRNVKGHPSWQEFEANLLNKQNKYVEVKEKLETINIRDQALRRLFPCAEEQFKTDSLSMQYYTNLIRQEDEENLNEAKIIIENYGWLGKSKVGLKGNNILWQVIQHSEVEQQIKFIPLIRASVQRGETLPHKLGYLEDRIRTNMDKNQIYGSQYMALPNGNFLYPVEDFNKINEKRRKIGLGPIEEYMEYLNISPYNHGESRKLMAEQKK